MPYAVGAKRGAAAGLDKLIDQYVLSWFSSKKWPFDIVKVDIDD
jgi:hypothetical protein